MRMKFDESTYNSAYLTVPNRDKLTNAVWHFCHRLLRRTIHGKVRANFPAIQHPNRFLDVKCAVMSVPLSHGNCRVAQNLRDVD